MTREVCLRTRGVQSVGHGFLIREGQEKYIYITREVYLHDKRSIFTLQVKYIYEGKTLVTVF